MTINRLHDDIERGMEAMWARQQDAKALEAIRQKLASEEAMGEKLAGIKAKQGSA